MNSQRLIQSHGGFALVDVIIGSILLAIGLATVISLSSRSLAMQVDGEKTLVASWLADEAMNMVLVEGPVNFPKRNDNVGRFNAPFEDFEYDILIEDRGAGQPHRVTSTVWWDGARGDRSVTVVAYIAERNDDPAESRVPPEPIDRMERWYEDEE